MLDLSIILWPLPHTSQQIHHSRLRVLSHHLPLCIYSYPWWLDSHLILSEQRLLSGLQSRYVTSSVCSGPKELRWSELEKWIIIITWAVLILIGCLEYLCVRLSRGIWLFFTENSEVNRTLVSRAVRECHVRVPSPSGGEGRAWRPILTRVSES